LKLFGGVLEMEAKRQVVAVSVGEDRISPRAIADFCHNKNQLELILFDYQCNKNNFSIKNK